MGMGHDMSAVSAMEGMEGMQDMPRMRHDARAR